MASELSKIYDPHAVEASTYERWVSSGAFAPADEGEPFSIVLPPPNVTGYLHMGHALDHSIQDAIIRRKRMQGFNTLWLPGTDHAGIATQNVVERQLAEQGKTRFDLGREGFVKRVWEWKQHSGDRITKQMRRLGNSVDWSRERFTMDPDLSRAVRTVFVTLYDEGLIYRGNRIINWCPRCHTALSDIEVEHSDVDGELVQLHYPLADGSGHITVATTRVETMLGDTGVVVHPDDERYQHLIGKTAILPLMEREIPVVADPGVEMEFGTGALKLTPAHDPLDFEIGQRVDAEAINIMNPDATLNENAGRFQGMDRYEARKAVLEALRAEGRVGNEERPYPHAVGHCSRCHTEVEPILSEQWFVKVEPLARPAIEAVRDGRTRFVPRRYERMYFDWMENLRDWCISRQLWWGHRIPVWTCSNGHEAAYLEDPPTCARCDSTELEQDPDVLDTWFSSALWPFSTLGWPEHTTDLRTWYPTSALVTGYDIITFWVSRMMMMGLHFMGKAPFAHVHIHGMVRDFRGKKMSKSFGNVIDPLDMIDRYGADALRLTLLRGATLERDVPLDEKWIEGDRNFANKLWNISRFVMMNIQGTEQPGDASSQSVATRLIVQRERERIAFRAASFWDIVATLETPDGSFAATLDQIDGRRLATGKDFDRQGALKGDATILDEAGANALAAALRDSTFEVRSVEEKPWGQSPRAPFMTSTLQQEAGRKLRFQAGRTMRIAQRLYENGYITYMRTDSVTLSETAVAAARAQAAEMYGSEVVPDAPRVYASKVKNAQEAHEAIRPAGDSFRTPDQVHAELSDEEFKLYDLIWKRTIASQMADARGRSVQVRIGATANDGRDATFAASGKTITFPGFLLAYVEGSDDPEAELEDQQRVLPPLGEGDRLRAIALEPKGHETQPPARYTEASLVKALEEKGIGRPSTLDVCPEEGVRTERALPPTERWILADRWILSRLDAVTREADAAMEGYDFARAAQTLRQFTWSEFADWYVEWSKGRLYEGTDQEKSDQAAVLSTVLERLLRLLHPLVPFITEEIWRALTGGETIMTQAWPAPAGYDDPDAEREMAFLQSLIAALRRFRSDHEIAPKTRPAATAVVPDTGLRMLLEAELERVCALASWGELSLATEAPDAGGEARLVLDGAVVHVPLAGLLDIEAERARLRKQKERHEQEAARIEHKLADPNFIAKAPDDVVETQRERLDAERDRIAHLDQALRDLG